MLPFLDADTLRVTEVLEDCKDAFLSAVGEEFEGPLGGVEVPSKDLFLLTPSAFPLLELLLGDGFLVVHSVKVPLGKNLVHGMHDATSHVGASVLGAFSNANEIIYKDINMSNRSSVPCEQGPIFGLRERLHELYELRSTEGTWWCAIPRFWRWRGRC